jgi:hypothetical protein
MADPQGMDESLAQALDLCSRMGEHAKLELKRVDAELTQHARGIDAVQRLQTIPGVGERVATAIYATVGDATRFHRASELASYAGLVPSVEQSGQSRRNGGITKEGTPGLRRMLVQAGHVLLFRCRTEQAAQAMLRLRLRSLGSRMEGWRPLVSGVLPTSTATDVSSRLCGAQLGHPQLGHDPRRSGPPRRPCRSAIWTLDCHHGRTSGSGVCVV